ncbi:zinc-ribbon and DUF3426 domain-containing protein [Paraburkholderia dinghuensis]|uniref:DUF3426 domain-containing protein n=1 Tax=Paraburkholderia dinghuensis TaxID=2305225 RepID=A0A3N6MB80_9BURK|nr:zinc-ribbon and DUF3426 domain-containing protein [Paraburkholderia dinghuensis]RQH01084.1 DUF3426 domain-containing protein [Paraburkholderia dinghuensis]
MLLATRCPFCETVFRIVPAQLAVRRGLVRCGHCQEAFDASGSLFEVPDNGEFANAVPVAADVAATLTAPATTHLPEEKREAVTSAGAPDFANPAWDPWAPPADSQIDNRLLYSAEHLPQPAIAPSVTPTFTPPLAEPSLAPEPATHASATATAAQSTASHWQRVEPGINEPTLTADEPSSVRTDDPEPVLPGAAAAASAAAAFSSLSPGAGPEPFAVTRETPARAPRRTGWRIIGSLFALVLLALLAAQLAWWLRETVMVYWPASKPLYEQACQQLGCRVLPPRDIDGLQVQPSDLRQVDDPHHLELKVPLRNHFNVALAFPAIELTLLDHQNNVVVRRVLWPQDYVTPGTRIEAGLPARTTQTMIVRLDTGNVVASNFRIEIFYP